MLQRLPRPLFYWSEHSPKTCVHFFASMGRPWLHILQGCPQRRTAQTICCLTVWWQLWMFWRKQMNCQNHQFLHMFRWQFWCRLFQWRFWNSLHFRTLTLRLGVAGLWKWFDVWLRSPFEFPSILGLNVDIGDFGCSACFRAAEWMEMNEGEDGALLCLIRGYGPLGLECHRFVLKGLQLYFSQPLHPSHYLARV